MWPVKFFASGLGWSSASNSEADGRGLGGDLGGGDARLGALYAALPEGENRPQQAWKDM